MCLRKAINQLNQRENEKLKKRTFKIARIIIEFRFEHIDFDLPDTTRFCDIYIICPLHFLVIQVWYNLRILN